MNYDDPNLIDMLAAEYVVGTLDGRARARFTRLMQGSADVQKTVWRWERQLNPLAATLAPAPPPARVWSAIERRIRTDSTSGSQATDFWTPLKRWRLWGALSTAVAILLAVSLAVTPVPQAPAPDRIAQFSAADDQPLWLISANLTTGTLRARAS